ncbi:alpha/beta fold hydrolase [Streptomyces silvisoli]|uniref:Alpha/beta hydrolase n=1 Tax=Streptomyces silvisoli TaxID=3034235 RepID=A0ABT5ZS80_9ACTN|nr:alpha/beta hydrolase [Streptomyces silvisoli]MDF3292672.1 alpha/beta hydrolase [Streptomyces silvisoli]
MDHYVTVSDGCWLWTASEGTGAPIIFVHGGPGLWDMFGELAGTLSSAFTTHRWDQRGCGRSPWPGPYSLDRTLADLDELRQHLGHERVTLIGHSWGANLALRYALAHPERVARLVYLSGTGLGRPQSTNWRLMRETMAPYLDRIDSVLRSAQSSERDRQLLLWRLSFGFADREAGQVLAARLTDPCFALNRDYAGALASQTAEFTEEQGVLACSALRVPTLVLHGTHDGQPPAVTDSLVAALPLVRRVLIDNAGHYPWLEQPSATEKALWSFLTETAPSDSSATEPA